jgi:hypothetical protein
MKNAPGSNTVRWAGPGFYLAHQGNRGPVWEKQPAYVAGAVWADEAADLQVPATTAIVAEAMRLVAVNQAERQLTAAAYGITE